MTDDVVYCIICNMLKTGSRYCFISTIFRKFKIKEKIENGSITEADFKKQRLFAGALQYEEEHLWLKRLKQDLLSSPKDEIQQR